jgi:hypothetical protein
VIGEKWKNVLEFVFAFSRSLAGLLAAESRAFDLF